LEAMLQEVTANAIRRTVQSKALKDETNGALHLLVGVKTKPVCRGVPLVAGRRRHEELTAARLAEPSSLESQPHPVQLCFAHRAFEPEQEAIVVVARRVHRLLIDEEDIREPAEL